jgi:hypothetical protein
VTWIESIFYYIVCVPLSCVSFLQCTDFYHFFDSPSIVHKDFLPPGPTVNHAFQKNVLERLRKRVQRVRKDIAGKWVLHHDNAPAHTALSVREFLAKKNIPTLPHLTTALI